MNLRGAVLFSQPLFFLGFLEKNDKKNKNKKSWCDAVKVVTCFMSVAAVTMYRAFMEVAPAWQHVLLNLQGFTANT